MEEKNIGNVGPTFEEIAIIEKATGGKISTYEWWVVRGINEPFTSYSKPKNDKDIIFHGVLENSFMSQGGEYIGNFEEARHYKKFRLKVYEPYPHGVAEAYNENGELEGYYGYTHRGGQVFKIGDRIFDARYEPKKEDYEQEQWDTWVKEYNDDIAKYEAEGDHWWVNDIKNDGISRYIPFKLRGAKIIKTLEDCAESAINLCKYLS